MPTKTSAELAKIFYAAADAKADELVGLTRPWEELGENVKASFIAGTEALMKELGCSLEEIPNG